MNTYITPPLGIIEGFFGRSWSWEDRAAYAGFLSAHAYDFYIYAPKNDSYLRKNWQQDWPQQTWASLHELRETFRAHGIRFGIGLSPFELYCNADSDQRAALVQKIKQLNRLQPDILCLLFDDMRGDLPDLAQIQSDLVHLAAEYTTATQIIFCPTYYSYDPILEKVFGQRPADYWPSIGQKLDQRINIFWTGTRVCSSDYSVAHLQEVAELLQRKPFLWDNYPVNDGAVKSKHLHLRSFAESHSQLGPFIAGHAANPMNQPWLSRIALASLPRAYHDAAHYDTDSTFSEACRLVCGRELGEYLQEDITLLQDAGLQALSAAQRDYLQRRYQPFAAESACARELCDWLNGGYAFDPACLTD